MSRLMSVSLTEAAVVAQTKTVTRRLGWLHARVGMRLTLCRKVMGRKPGEPLVRLAEVEVVSVRREQLEDMPLEDLACEGFPEWTTVRQFVEFFCQHMRCTPDTEVTRIEWRYLEPSEVEDPFMSYIVIDNDGELHHRTRPPTSETIHTEVGHFDQVRLQPPCESLRGFVPDTGLVDGTPRNLIGSLVLIACNGPEQPYAGPIVITGWDPPPGAEIVNLPPDRVDQLRWLHRLEIAEIALHVLSVLPQPDQHPAFTGWISHAAGLDADTYGYFVPTFLYNLLRRLVRLGLVEVDRTWGRPHWRLTEAGARFEGTAADLARPIRSPR